ncbi:MAG TPA: SDR family NAD(P)-dependent oxidoreductase [Acidobacteriaceae bacterium]|jgi:NADP-dependent 3-hydroxy acid dehydrogenase YdfG|nr:SDR family NAD(P)-dependent oxidoreductase [Acidobacteriaceae bacterium]
MSQLASQIAVVTGAGRGAGEAIARKLAAMGAHVLLVARDAASLSKVQQEIQKAGGQLPCPAIFSILRRSSCLASGLRGSSSAATSW